MLHAYINLLIEKSKPRNAFFFLFIFRWYKFGDGILYLYISWPAIQSSMTGWLNYTKVFISLQILYKVSISTKRVFAIFTQHSLS